MELQKPVRRWVVRGALLGQLGAAVTNAYLLDMVLAYHLILTGYGHWLPNDPRGSMSTNVVAGKLLSLRIMHFGRKRTQPPRTALKDFYLNAEHQLEHTILWFDSAKRQIISDAFSEVVESRRYTCFACAILANHAHVIIRKHRDRAEDMILELKSASAIQLRRLDDVPGDHPVWSSDRYKKFLSTAEDVERTMRYVERNPRREGMAPQRCSFVVPYRGEWSGRLRRSPTSQSASGRPSDVGTGP